MPPDEIPELEQLTPEQEEFYYNERRADIADAMANKRLNQLQGQAALQSLQKRFNVDPETQKVRPREAAAPTPQPTDPGPPAGEQETMLQLPRLNKSELEQDVKEQRMNGTLGDEAAYRRAMADRHQIVDDSPRQPGSGGGFVDAIQRGLEIMDTPAGHIRVRAADEKNEVSVAPSPGAKRLFLRSGISPMTAYVKPRKTPIISPEDYAAAKRGQAPGNQELLERRGMKRVALSDILPGAFTDKERGFDPRVGENWKFKKGGVADLTNTGTLGGLEDIATDPTVPAGMLARGLRAVPGGIAKLLGGGRVGKVASAAVSATDLALNPIERLLQDAAYPVYKQAFKPIDRVGFKSAPEYRPKPPSQVFFGGPWEGDAVTGNAQSWEKARDPLIRKEAQKNRGIEHELEQQGATINLGDAYRRTVRPDPVQVGHELGQLPLDEGPDAIETLMNGGRRSPMDIARRYQNQKFTKDQGDKALNLILEEQARGVVPVKDVIESKRVKQEVTRRGMNTNSDRYGNAPSMSAEGDTLRAMGSDDVQMIEDAIRNTLGEEKAAAYRESNRNMGSLLSTQKSIPAQASTEATRGRDNLFGLSAVDVMLLSLSLSSAADTGNPSLNAAARILGGGTRGMLAYKKINDVLRHPRTITTVGRAMQKAGRKSIWDPIARRSAIDNNQDDQEKKK